jgi:MFS family permease
VNVPIGVFATVWAFRQLRELSTPLRGEKLDPLGNVTFAGGLTLFLLGLTLGALAGFDNSDYGLMVVGLLLLVLFVLVERRVTNPMMDVSLFKNRMFAGGILSNFLAALARGAVSLVLVFYFQGPLQLDALTAGVLLIPFSVAFVALGPVSGYLSDRYGARGLATVGLVISGVAFLWFATITVTTPYSQLLIPMVLAGIGSGMFVAPNIASIMNSVPPTRRGIASGMSSTLVSAGVLLSLGVSFAIMATSVPLQVLQSIFAGLPVPGGQEVNVDLFMNAIHEIFIIMGIASFAAVLPSSLRGGRFVDTRVQAQDKLISSSRDVPVTSGGE